MQFCLGTAALVTMVRRRMCIFVSVYCSNKGFDTIDDELIAGLHKAGCISDSNFFDENKFVKVWN